MKVFLSHPMHGYTEAEVMALREAAIEKLKPIYGDGITIIDNYHHDDAPENAGRVWHLGKSIQMMSEADLVVFCSGWVWATGCKIEQDICNRYNLPTIYLSDL